MAEGRWKTRGVGYSFFSHFGIALQVAIILFLLFDWAT